MFITVFQILIGILKAQIRALDSSDVPKFQILIGILKAAPKAIMVPPYMHVSNPYRYSKSSKGGTGTSGAESCFKSL